MTKLLAGLRKLVDGDRALRAWLIGSLIAYPPKKPIKMQTYQPNVNPHPNQVEKACRAALKAKRPTTLTQQAMMALIQELVRTPAPH